MPTTVSETVPLPIAEPDCVELSMGLSEYLEFIVNPELSGHKVEWADGITFIMAPARRRHGFVQLAIGAILKRDLTKALVAVEGGVKTNTSRRFADVLVYDDDPEDEMFVDSSAILVVEVISPGSWRTDLGAKADEYASLGVPHYWTVDYESRSVTIRTHTGTGWHVEAVLDEANPALDVSVEGRGTVKLRLAEVFGPIAER